MGMKRVVELSLILLVVLLSQTAEAADFRVEGKGIVKVFVMEGEIAAGDTEKFTNLVRSQEKTVWPIVYLLSPGGDFEESMRLGRALRALEMQSFAPTRTSTGAVCPQISPIDPANCTCASACFFVHIGSAQRSGSYLAVHRPYFAKGRFGQIPEKEAEKEFSSLQERALAYMKEMGVPARVIEDTLATASDQALLLDQRTIDLYFTGYLPARREWLRNRCSSLSPDDEARYQHYFRRVVEGDARGLELTDVLSPSEIQDMAALGDKNSSPSCILDTMKRRRSEAFDQYFSTAR